MVSDQRKVTRFCENQPVLPRAQHEGNPTAPNDSVAPHFKGSDCVSVEIKRWVVSECCRPSLRRTRVRDVCSLTLLTNTQHRSRRFAPTQITPRVDRWFLALLPPLCRRVRQPRRTPRPRPERTMRFRQTLLDAISRGLSLKTTRRMTHSPDVTEHETVNVTGGLYTAAYVPNWGSVAPTR